MKAPNCKCLQCGNTFYIKPSQLLRGRGKFCSKQCKYNFNKVRITTKCINCGKKFEVKKSTFEKGFAKNCSRECANKYYVLEKRCNWKNGISLLPKPGIAKGEKHWNWKGGITKKVDAIRASSSYKLWRKKVFERDNYTCQNCGKKGGYLQVHHLECLSDNLEKATDIENGITLCLPCHCKTDTYGFKKGKK